jgi:hypothetical protein
MFVRYALYTYAARRANLDANAASLPFQLVPLPSKSPLVSCGHGKRMGSASARFSELVALDPSRGRGSRSSWVVCGDLAVRSGLNYVFGTTTAKQKLEIYGWGSCLQTITFIWFALTVTDGSGCACTSRSLLWRTSSIVFGCLNARRMEPFWKSLFRPMKAASPPANVVCV